MRRPIPENGTWGGRSHSFQTQAFTRPCVLDWRCLSRSGAFLAVAILVAAQVGCVRKRMTFRTNPSGAMVYVDKQPVGLTPVSTGFTYYGTRNIEVVKDGYRTEKFLRKIHAPWYQIPPLDFFSDTLWPFEQRDERIIDVQMTPEQEVPNDALVATGEQLRLQASQGVAVTPPPTATQPVPPILVPTTPVVVPPYAPPVAGGYPAPVSTQSTSGWLRDLFFPYGAPLSLPSTEVTPGGGFRPPSE
ncbi:MAG: PEGA domain-containing protein [Planctomycetes bacterium]|nr:PEGA domain-containing protein [Planctomycetota bacterium]